MEAAQEVKVDEADARERRLRAIYGAVGLSALLSFASFHPLDMGALAYAALVPLLVVAAGEPRRVALLMAYCVTVLYHVPGLSWIAATTPPGWLTTAGLEGLYGVALIGLSLWLRRRSGLPLAIGLPVVGVALEWVRANCPFVGFPWLLWGHSQHAASTLIQIADVTSVYGVSFFVLAVNGGLADAALLWRERQAAREDLSPADHRRLGVALGLPAVLLLLLLGYGALRRNQVKVAMEDAGPGPRLLLIQVDVPQSLKDGVGMTALQLANENLRMSIAALKWRDSKPVAAMLWSETMWPWPLPDRRPEAGRGVGYDEWYAGLERKAHPSYMQAFRAVHRELFSIPLALGAPLLVGAVDLGLEGGPYHNSYYQISPSGDEAEITARYDKIELVPVAEGIPFKDPGSPMHWFFRFMKLFVPPGFEVFARGEGPVLMKCGDFQLAPCICFEISFPELLRQSTAAGADVLVCPANDAWFVRGKEEAKATAEIPLARAQSVFRAIENRRSVVRCVNRGVSLCIDPTGDVVDEIKGTGPDGEPRSVGVASYLAVDAPVTRLRSFWVRFGGVFPALCFLGAAALLVVGWQGRVLLAPSAGVPREHLVAAAAPATEPSATEAPADEAPADEAPGDEPPGDELPADEARPEDEGSASG
ncbi:MAG: apolipoprotein N-acyltransferase [Planctomycetota bacterium]